MRRLFTFVPVLVLGLLAALVTPAQAATVRHYAARDAHGDVQKWNGGDAHHAGRSIDIRRMSWSVTGSGGQRRLTATLRLRRVWPDGGGEYQGADFGIYLPNHVRSADVSVYGPLRHGKPVLMTIGNGSDTRRILGCSSLRQVKHLGADTVSFSMRLSCLPQRFRTTNVMLSAASFIGRGNTTYWFDETRTIRHANLS